MIKGLFLLACTLLLMAAPWLTNVQEKASALAATDTVTTDTAPSAPVNDTFQIPGTPVAVLEFGDYEGAFVEDGSDEPVCCFCIVLENTGDEILEYVRIRLDEMVFEATYLMPGTKTLVLEKNKAPFSMRDIRSCICEAFSYADMPETSAVYVCPSGDWDMIATNLTPKALSAVEIRYKQYLPEANMYLGGITYSAVIAPLPPEESQRISPYHYLTDRGKIVFVSVQ